MALRISKNRVKLESIPLNLAQSASIASSSTVNLATATGNEIHITGSTGPITSFGTVAAGTQCILIFDSTPTITYNATSMILNTNGLSYACAAGDRALAVSEGAGNWIVNIMKKDGSPVTPGLPLAVSSGRNLAATDNGLTLVCSALLTLTVPSGLPAGFGCVIMQNSASQVTIAAGASVTIVNVSTQTKTSGLYAVVAVLNTTTDTYVLVGSTGA